MQQDKNYIYFDWNVIKYMKESRSFKKDLDERLRAVVLRLKNKFKFPYSHAHIRDLSHNYSEKYKEKTYEDLTFAESINDNFCVASPQNKDLKELSIINYPMKKFFEEEITNPKPNDFSFNAVLPLQEHHIDMDELDEKHPMYEFLLKNDGILSRQDMSEFINELGTYIFEDTNRYKIFRNYIQSINLTEGLKCYGTSEELIIMDTILIHLFPFLDSFNDDEMKLKQKWQMIAQNFFSVKKANQNLNISLEQLLIHGYVLLDMHPLFKEKLKKGKNTLDNIVRDGNHCFFASKARYFVSEDLLIRKKISFLYDVYNIETKILSEEEFVNRFDLL